MPKDVRDDQAYLHKNLFENIKERRAKKNEGPGSEQKKKSEIRKKKEIIVEN